MQWFKSIEDINNHLKLKQGKGISLQVDNTATPRETMGSALDIGHFRLTNYCT